MSARTILVLNSKGGCGKTTIATNLAAYYAQQGRAVCLADFDPQRSSLQWLEARSPDRPKIEGAAAFDGGFRLPRTADVVIMDAPAAIHGADLTALVRRAQTILIPVLPSATDMRAAARCVHALLTVGKVARHQTRLATIANRVPPGSTIQGAVETVLNSVHLPYQSVQSQIYRPLERFLARLRIPFVATLNDSPSYALADAQGLGVYELRDSRSVWDWVPWRPLVDWLDSRRSLPRAV
ncbi:MAG: ParA family protein [Pseudomonadota bacterium]|nr:MAG: ParA family protein [Pseudomonadota bacterium]